MSVSRIGLPWATLFSCIAALLPATRADAQRPDAKPQRQLAARSQPDSELVTRERAMWQALQDQDTLTFQRAMANVVDVDLSGIRRTTPGSAAKYVTQCRLAAHTLSDFRITRDSLVAIVTYQAIIEQTCWGQKAPSPLNVLTVFERRPSGWVPVAHSETPAVR